MPNVVLQTEIRDFPVKRGKVRDVYDLGDDLLIVATDRISAFDVVLPTGIPCKGQVLTQMSVFWFERLADLTPSHYVSAPASATEVALIDEALGPHARELVGRSMLVTKAKVLPVECVVRGYLAGSGWKSYRTTGEVCGVKLPPGLVESSELPEPIFTPTTKAETGHDEAISFERVSEMVGRDVAEQVRERSIAIYSRARDYAAARGVIICDTKFEWGLVPKKELATGNWQLASEGTEPAPSSSNLQVESCKLQFPFGSSLETHDLILVDEVLTPDSSRFWPAEGYAPGGPQPSYDKQFVRDWLEASGWNKTPPAPELPPDVVAKTSAKYIEAYEKLTGKKFVAR